MLKLNTVMLQSMLSKVGKGAGNNKLISKTEMLIIELKGGTLKLVTTSGDIYMQAIRKNVSGEDFYVAVQVGTFTKLISKITSEDVSFELQNVTNPETGALESQNLVVTGNGVYNIPLILEGGEPVRFLNYELPSDGTPEKLTLEVIKSMLKSNKLSVSSDVDQSLVGYYFCPSGVYTTNRKMCCYLETNSTNSTFMLPAKTVDLLETASSDVNMYVVDMEVERQNGEKDIKRYVKLETDDIVIHSSTIPCQNFPVIQLQNQFNAALPNKLIINRNILLNALDRVLLFSDKENYNALELTLSGDFLGIKNSDSGISGSVAEGIPCTAGADVVSRECRVNGVLFRTAIQACQSEEINLYYSETSLVLIIQENNLYQLLTLLSEQQYKGSTNS